MLVKKKILLATPPSYYYYYSHRNASSHLKLQRGCARRYTRAHFLVSFPCFLSAFPPFIIMGNVFERASQMPRISSERSHSLLLSSIPDAVRRVTLLQFFHGDLLTMANLSLTCKDASKDCYDQMCAMKNRWLRIKNLTQIGIKAVLVVFVL